MAAQLSLGSARALHLAAQGLLSPSRRTATRSDVLATIQRMALLQIDTIHVVARSAYLVLWSRLGDYDPAWLDELLSDGALFEYWAHEACLVPIEDYALLRHRMLDPGAMGWKYSLEWMQSHAADIAYILAHVRINGAVRSADFERLDGKAGGWWGWKPEKRHLETLFTTGELMVARRDRFQRVYDLRERVLPGWDDARDLPPVEHARAEMLRRSCRALGLFKPAWLADYYRLKRVPAVAAVHAMADAGELIPARVERWRHDVFVHRDLQPLLEAATNGTLKPTLTTLLSSFDPVVWDRKRAQELFDFDYRIECYTPAPKRKYGYFCLPILSRGRLVGRLDAKAHRKLGEFEVKSLHLEPGIRMSQRLADDVTNAIRRCAAWHATPVVRISEAAGAFRDALT